MIRFDDITLQYDKKTILTDFSLDIKKGDKILIAGKSGIGKTTLFKMILGFVVPDKGAITFENKPFIPNTVWDIRKKASYVSQHMDIGSGKIQDLIREIFAYKSNASLQRDGSVTEEFIEFLELKRDIFQEQIETLSGGEKQRIAILIALMLQRNLFLLDEPTAFLDTGLKKKIAHLFADKKEWTVIVTSHDPCWRHQDIFKTIHMG